MLNAVTVRETPSQNICLRDYDRVSTRYEDSLQLVKFVVLAEYVAESRDQPVFHVVLRCTAVHEQVDRVIAGLVHALVVGYYRK